MKFDAVVIPVADVDRSKGFYTKLGWRLDADFPFDNGFRVVQFTPPGSGCSVQFGTKMTSAAPGSAQGLDLIVSDIEASRKELVARGIEVSDVFHAGRPGAQFQVDGSGRISGPAPEHAIYRSVATFRDPDGNGWLFQEITNRLRGGGLSDDAYTRPEFWLYERWDNVKRAAWQAPLYWRRDPQDKTGWRVFTLTGWHGLSALLNTPVCHVSFFEADAFARWRGCRLPTEAEWEYVASQTTVQGNLLDTGTLHPTGARGAGIEQLFGDCWEWTASATTGYPGYKPLPGALGEYNGKFMCGQVILRGGSCVTPASHIRATYRNYFPPATRWQFAGIRLAA